MSPSDVPRMRQEEEPIYKADVSCCGRVFIMGQWGIDRLHCRLCFRDSIVHAHARVRFQHRCDQQSTTFWEGKNETTNGECA